MVLLLRLGNPLKDGLEASTLNARCLKGWVCRPLLPLHHLVPHGDRPKDRSQAGEGPLFAVMDCMAGLLYI